MREWPFIAWRPNGRVCVVNRGLADIVGEPPADLIGREILDLADRFWPDPSVPRPALDLVHGGGVEKLQFRGDVQPTLGRSIPLRVEARPVELGAEGWAGAAVGVPAEMPAARSEELLDGLVLAVVDHEGRAVAVGGDVLGTLGGDADEVVGTALWDRLAGDAHARPGPEPLVDTPLDVELRDSDDGSHPASILWARQPGEPAEWVVALMPGPRPGSSGADRADELERRLSRIAAELEAAGLPIGSGTAHDQTVHAAKLSDRQWEVLNRLLAGMTPAEIGAELFVSPSTVRNHLSAIFQKFGVHSQIELLRRLSSGH